jgi:hypothetical protein
VGLILKQSGFLERPRTSICEPGGRNGGGSHTRLRCGICFDLASVVPSLQSVLPSKPLFVAVDLHKHDGEMTSRCHGCEV